MGYVSVSIKLNVQLFFPPLVSSVVYREVNSPDQVESPREIKEDSETTVTVFYRDAIALPLS